MKSMHSGQLENMYGNAERDRYFDTQSLPIPPLYETITLTNTSKNNKDDENSQNKHFLTTDVPETSTYETLESPFKHDKSRGSWSSSGDFYFACAAHSIGTQVFSEVPMFGFVFAGTYFFVAYFIALILYMIPIFGIQTFLGQFSTSGTISAFRVAPLFKGFGYSILLLNLCCLSFSAVIAAIPLLYAANSLHNNLPWMSCNNTWNSLNCSEHNDYDEKDDYLDPHATVEFFRYIVRSDEENPLAMSWPLMTGMLGIWLLTLGLLRKRVSFLGKFFRCCCFITLVIFIAVTVNIIWTNKISAAELQQYIKPIMPGYQLTATGAGLFVAVTMTSYFLGPGWGNVLTLASHNRFSFDSERAMYWMGFTCMILALIITFLGRIAYDNFESEVGLYHYHYEENHYMQFLCICYAYLFGSLPSLANFWSFIFFFMIFVAELNALLVQCMTFLTALFDEFEKLRPHKSSIIFGLVGSMMLISTYFCTKSGFEKLHILPIFGLIANVIISLVLLLMATWVYGRDRFQCDLQFMLGKTVSNFKIVLLRFVTPIFLGICIIKSWDLVELSPSHHEVNPITFNIIGLLLILTVAAVYIVYKIYHTAGSLKNRLRQCFKPHDWHPVNADNRRFYEEIMGISEMLIIDNDQQCTTHV